MRTAFFWLGLLLMSLPVAALAEAAQLVFVTDERQVAPGVISDVITLEIRDESGSPVNLGETGDLILESSSADGEFVNQNGEPLSPTWNSNWSRRNLYYRDDSPGTYELTATVTGRTSGRSWEASQSIRVGNGSGGGEESGGGESETGGSTTVTSGTAPRSAPPRAAGASLRGPSVVLLGARAEFQAEVSRGSEASGAPILTWSFGDGGAKRGTRVSHEYQYPGRYVVALQIRQAGEETVLRHELVVKAASVAITAVTPEYIELTNQAGESVDLGHWQLALGDRDFVLPVSLVVAPRQAIKIPAATSGLRPAASAAVMLRAPVGTTVESWPPPPPPALLPKPAVRAAPQPAPVAPAVELAPVSLGAPAPVAAVAAVATADLPRVVTLPRAPGWWQRVQAFFNRS